MKKTNKKRGYFIHGGDPQGGFAVVAISLQEARQIVYRAGEIEADWIDITGYWCRNAKIDDLPIGIIEDLRLGLIRGMFSYLEDFECDVCGDISLVQCYRGQVMCIECQKTAESSGIV